MAAGVIDGVVYLAGGWTPGVDASASVVAYVPRTHHWTRRASMPTARAVAAATVAGGRLYVIGGMAYPGGAATLFSTVESYDPVTDSWRTEPSLPIPLAYASAATVGRTIYVLGGQSRNDGTGIASSAFALTLPP